MAPKIWYLLNFFESLVYHCESLGVCMEALLNTELESPCVVN